MEDPFIYECRNQSRRQEVVLEPSTKRKQVFKTRRSSYARGETLVCAACSILRNTCLRFLLGFETSSILKGNAAARTQHTEPSRLPHGTADAPSSRPRRTRCRGRSTERKTPAPASAWRQTNSATANRHTPAPLLDWPGNLPSPPAGRNSS